MADRGDLLDIQAVVRQLGAIDTTYLHGLGVGVAVLELERMSNAVAACLAFAHDVHEREGQWAEVGATSAARWVAARTNTSAREVQGRIRDGVALRLLPSAASPARRGELSSDHLRSLARCVDRHPLRAVEDEDLLVGQALELSAPSFRITTRRWRDHADDLVNPPTGDGDTAPRSRFHLSEGMDGTYDVAGRLTPEHGTLLAAILGAHVDRFLRAAHDDPAVAGRLRSELQAEALMDLCGQAMRHCGCEGSVPDRYRVAVTIDLDQHETDASDQRAEPPMETCDSTMYRGVLGADGEILDIGRDTRKWSKGIRRAITLRDGQCVFPGCDRPPDWCDVHHCRPWEDGGDTKVGNGALLCRLHHTFLHAKQWSIRFDGCRPRVHRPDGTLFTITRWEADDPGPTSDP